MRIKRTTTLIFIVYGAISSACNEKSYQRSTPISSPFTGSENNSVNTYTDTNSSENTGSATETSTSTSTLSATDTSTSTSTGSGTDTSTSTSTASSTSSSTSTSTSVAVEQLPETLIIYRLFNGADHLLSKDPAEKINNGYVFEGPAFKVFKTNTISDLVPIYRCYVASLNDHFISRSAACEGQVAEGLYGYVYKDFASDRKALYRFMKASGGGMDHLSTLNYNEGINGGYALEGILGYVPQ